MISNLVFVGADDYVDDFKKPCTRGCWDTTLIFIPLFDKFSI